MFEDPSVIIKKNIIIDKLFIIIDTINFQAITFFLIIHKPSLFFFNSKFTKSYFVFLKNNSIISNNSSSLLIFDFTFGKFINNLNSISKVLYI